MGTVIVEQFNPVHGYFNKLYEVDSADFDPDVPITVDKYGGPYRIKHIGEKVVVEDPIPEVVEEEEELEEEDPPKYDDSRW